MGIGPGRPVDSLPTASHLLSVLDKYEKETNIISDELTLAEIKQKLSSQIVFDELQKREKNKEYMKQWRQEKANKAV